MLSSKSKFSKSEKELEDGEIEDSSYGEEISDEDFFDLYENSQIPLIPTGSHKKMETISIRPTFSDVSSSEDSDYSESHGKRKRSNFRLQSTRRTKMKNVFLPDRPGRQDSRPRVVFDVEKSPKKLPVVVKIAPVVSTPQYDICKYYLKNNCHRQSDCNFMHSDFPCKYFYLGLKCPAKDNCLYLHGGVLSGFLKKVLVDHIQSAPQSVLGKFNRYGRFKAGKLIDAFNQRLQSGETNQNLSGEEPAMGKSDNYLSLSKLEGVLNNEQIQLLADNKIYSLDEISKLTIRQLKEFNFSDQLIDKLLLNIKNLTDLGLPVGDFVLQSIEKPTFITPEKVVTKIIPMDDLFSFSNEKPDDLPAVNHVPHDLPVFSHVPHYQMNLGNGPTFGNRTPFYHDTDLKYVSFENEQPMQPTASSINYSQFVSETNINFTEDFDEIDGEEQLVIDEHSEKEYDEEVESITVCKKSSVREADSTNEDNTDEVEHRYDAFVSLMKLEKREIQVNTVDSDDNSDQLPFQPFLTNFIPATEIFASINSHSLIEYKLIEIEIPNVKIKKNVEKYNLMDPRMKLFENDEKISPKLKLKIILQKSEWFRNLNSIHQTMVSDQINVLSIELEKFEQKISLCKVFDVEIVTKNVILNTILNNLNIYINVNGEVVERFENKMI